MPNRHSPSPREPHLWVQRERGIRLFVARARRHGMDRVLSWRWTPGVDTVLAGVDNRACRRGQPCLQAAARASGWTRHLQAWTRHRWRRPGRFTASAQLDGVDRALRGQTRHPREPVVDGWRVAAPATQWMGRPGRFTASAQLDGVDRVPRWLDTASMAPGRAPHGIGPARWRGHRASRAGRSVDGLATALL